MKKILVLPMLLFGCFVDLARAQTYTDGQWTYTLDEQNEATITGYSESDGPVDIPLRVGDYPVTAIGQWAFAFKGITSVSIPEGVKTIGASAFFGSPYFPSATIPVSVTNIGSRAFYDCRGITNFTVLPGNTNYSSLGGVLFDAAQETLVQFPVGRGGEYQVPVGVVRIGELAFAASLDPGLTFVSLPDTVTHIDGGAFQNNTSLTNIEISKNLSVIGDGAFVNCGSLTNVVFPNNLSVVGSDAFASCAALTNVIMSEGVLAIGGGAFARTAISSISIPASVTHIGVAAFQYCTNLMSINVEPANPTYTSIDGVLFDADETTLLQFACGRLGAYTVPNGTTSLATGSFKGASKLTSVSIPNTVGLIDDEVFFDCSELIDIRVALGVTTIGLSCFSGCNALESIVFPYTLTHIGALAFDRCSSLRSILFLGNAPLIALHPFYPDLQSLGNAPNSWVHYLYGSVGWQTLFGDHPTAMTQVFTDTQYAANRSQGQADVTTHPSAFNLYTQEQRDSFGIQQYSNGQSSVTSNPSTFDLFTQEQFDSNRSSGQFDVINSPISYGLYTSDSIMDLRMDGLMLQKQGSNAVVTFQTQTTTDLATQPFTNNGTAITNTIPMPGNKGFLRIQANPTTIPPQ